MQAATVSLALDGTIFYMHDVTEDGAVASRSVFDGPNAHHGNQSGFDGGDIPGNRPLCSG